MKKLSIVIPVYNVEKYIERCIKSVLHQDIPAENYEIIIINDGAKDHSLKIVEELTKGQTNVRIHSQENAGLSAARNKGLSLSTGEYIWFIDSDDWIEENCLQTVLKRTEEADLLMMGYVKYFDDTKKNQQLLPPSEQVFSGQDLLEEDFFAQVPFYVYRRKFLLENQLNFMENIYHEDAEFTPRTIFAASKVQVLMQPIYYVYKRPGSITTTSNIKRVFDLITVASSLEKFKLDKKREIQKIFNNKIGLALNNALFMSYKMNRKQIKEMNQGFFQVSHLFRCLRDSTIRKYQIEGQLFQYFPRRVVFVYQLLQKINRNKPQEMESN